MSADILTTAAFRQTLALVSVKCWLWICFWFSYPWCSSGNQFTFISVKRNQRSDLCRQWQLHVNTGGSEDDRGKTTLQFLYFCFLFPVSSHIYVFSSSQLTLRCLWWCHSSHGRLFFGHYNVGVGTSTGQYLCKLYSLNSIVVIGFHQPITEEPCVDYCVNINICQVLHCVGLIIWDLSTIFLG